MLKIKTRAPTLSLTAIPTRGHDLVVDSGRLRRPQSYEITHLSLSLSLSLSLYM